MNIFDWLADFKCHFWPLRGTPGQALAAGFRNVSGSYTGSPSSHSPTRLLEVFRSRKVHTVGFCDRDSTFRENVRDRLLMRMVPWNIKRHDNTVSEGGLSIATDTQ